MESGKTDHSPENVLQRVEFTKGSDEERQFCERKFQEAKTLLAKYFPSFVPQEPTILISAPFAQLDEEFVGIPGSYNGSIRGKHYITLGIMHPDYYKQSLAFVQKPEELVVTEAQEDLITLRLAHELIHQRNAEIGGNRYDPFSLDSVVTDEEVARLPVERLLSVANERFRRSVLDSEIIVSSVTNYVDEGLASAGEYFLMDKVIEEHEKNGRKKMADVIKQAKQQFKDFVKRPSNVKYRDGLHIVSTLNNARGIERMPFILTEIDIDACDKIEEGTVAYNRIVEDPTRIPMKENT